MAKQTNSKLRQAVFALLFVLGGLALLFGTMFLVEFISDKANEPVEFEEGESVEIAFVDPETGKKFTACSTSLGTLNRTELYGEFEGRRFYRVGLMDENWLVEGEELDGLIYVAEGQEVPDLASFNAIAAQIYVDGVDNWVGKFLPSEVYLEDSEALGDNYVDESRYTNLTVTSLVHGEDVGMVVNVDPSYTYYIRLLSADYPWLYYEVSFLRDTNGINYLFDRGTGKTVKCPDELTVRLCGAE